MTKKYNIAQEQAINYILKNYPNTIAIIVSGSIVRNKGDKNSDLDIYVIHSDSFRQRLTKYFNGVPCDLLINNLNHIEKYFQQEYKKNRPVTADIIATGHLVYGKENQEVINLIAKAKKETSVALTLTTEASKLKQVELLIILEDIDDVIKNDPTLANYLIYTLILKIIEFAFIKSEIPLSRIKNRLDTLNNNNKEIGSLVTKFFKTEDVEIKFALCKTLIELLVDLDYLQQNLEWSTEKDFTTP